MTFEGVLREIKDVLHVSSLIEKPTFYEKDNNIWI
jgi:hypothetical protein